MKLRASLKYQLFSYLKPLGIFYGVVLLLTALSGPIFRAQIGPVSMVGNDLASLIFLFILGLNSVKDSFKLMAVNGRTRRTAFFAIALGTLVACVFMAATDMLLSPVFSRVYERYGTLYDILYGKAQGLGGMLVEYGWRVALYGFAALSGVWVSALYYRMSKGFRIGVSVGVPALLAYALAKLAAANDAIGKALAHAVSAIARAVIYMFGFNGIEPQPAMFCLWGTVLILATAGIFWACMRRAEVRE